MGNNRSRSAAQQPRETSAQFPTPGRFTPSNDVHWEQIEGGKVARVPGVGSDLYVCLDSVPGTGSLWFECPSCGHENYDGGLHKVVHCPCGLRSARTVRNEVETSPERSEDPFDLLFECVNHRPPDRQVPELKSLSFGVFANDLLEDFMPSGRLTSSALFSYIFGPFFLERVRCLGLGDYFCVGDFRFKVLACSPSFGQVTPGTAMACVQLLERAPVRRLQLLSVGGLPLDQEFFRSSIGPFFTGRTRHVQSDELLYLGGRSLSIVAADPPNGLVTQESSIYFEGPVLPHLNSVHFAVYVENLPMQLQALSRSEFIATILHYFLLPSMQGFRRLFNRGEIITISGISFKVVTCDPPRGLSHDNTMVIFGGEVVSRVFEGLNNPNVPVNERMRILHQQFQQLQEILNSMGPAEPVGADPDVIRQFPVHRLTTLSQDQEQSSCMICMNEYELEEEVRTLPCFHRYHSGCIEQWLERSTACPICKFQVC